MQKTDIHGVQAAAVQRVTFLDSLRYLFVFGVVLQHAGMAYVDSGWWPAEDGFSIFVGLLVTVTDGFLMPGLFYISGYFAVPSIQSKSISTFIKGKLKRLGIPWLVCNLFICPILPLIYHYTHDGFQLNHSYFSIWLRVMKNAAGLDIGILPPMPQVMQNDLFYQRYMWFISLLLLFFLIFTLFYIGNKEWFASSVAVKPLVPTVQSISKLILTVGFITFAGSFCLIGLVLLCAPNVSNPEAWFTLGNLVQFRVSRVFLHGTYFILGILTYKWNWIEQGRFPGHPKGWIVFFLIVLFPYLTFKVLVETGPEELKDLFGLVFWFFLNFFTISALGFACSSALKFLNRPTPINRTLASNSYNIYLAHYLFVILFQAMLCIIPGLPLLKYLLVFVLSLSAAYISAKFLLTPHPRITVALLAGLFGVMIVIL